MDLRIPARFAAMAATAVLIGVPASSPPVSAQADAPGHASIVAPPGGSFYGLTPQFAVSPDGAQVVFVAESPSEPPRLWVQALATGRARVLIGTDQASYPFWSADSRFVGFFASGKLKKIAMSGGAPVIVCDASNGRGGTWNHDDVIVFTSGIADPLRKVSAAGGTAAPTTEIDKPRETSHRWPQFLPDGKHFLFWAGGGSAPAQLKVGSLDSRDVVAVTPADSNGAFAAGFVFFSSHEALMAVPVDAVSWQRTGDPVRVAGQLSGDAGSSYASLSAASAGTLLYTPGKARGFVLTWFDRNGKRLGTVGQAGLYTNAAVSPDGRRIAVSLTQGAPANRDLWMLPMGGGPAMRLTTDPSVDAGPIWSADGRALVFSSQRGGVYQMYRKVENAAEELLLKSDVSTIATDWSRDGRYVAYTRGSGTALDVWALPLFGTREPLSVTDEAGADDNAVFSPDGRWVAYQSDTSGRNEIYVRPFAAAGAGNDGGRAAPAAVRISRDGATQPLWRRDGRELIFRALDGAVMAAPIPASRPAAEPAPRRLFPAPLSLVIRRAYDISPDGQRILMPMFDETVKQTISVVPHWAAPLTQRR